MRRQPANHHRIFAVIGIVLFVVAGVFSAQVRGAEPPAEFSAADLEFFEKEIRPLLAARCYECHGPDVDEPKGGLRIDSREALLAGGDTGTAVVPGKPEVSLLIDSVNYGDVYQMPPRTKLPEKEIAALTKWVKLGAPWPAAQAVARNEENSEFSLTTRRDTHWAWRPIAAQTVPEVARRAWTNGPIDSFILAKLEARQISPAPQADAPALLRRLYFDLTGLPPPAEEAERFVAEAAINRPAAIEEVVDRLLASPAFGERFGRHWLDLVRYAETRGHEFDFSAANAWHYRDYVIRATSDDVPYDRFVTEHVAGDLLERPRRNAREGFNESILATGFWHLGEWVHSPVDIRQDETDRFDNMIDVFGKTFLGLTVACARCHDHKFDAISQQDYYALSGFLQSSEYRQARFDTMEQHREIAARLEALEKERGPAILAATTSRLASGIKRLDEYLMAAAQAIAKSARDDQVASLAAERNLSLKQLTEWLAYLRMAQGSPADLLHPFAAAVAGSPIPAPISDCGASEHGKRIIIDYAAAPAQVFMADGPTFGRGPVRPAELLLPMNEGAGPRFAEYGAVRRDLRWKAMKLAPGVQGESGKLANIEQAGKTLRTPTFTIQEGDFQYLVRGAGYAYAVVDSHRLVNGPLHGELVIEFNITDQPAWVHHKLTAYRGHDVHIEFIARGESELEILKVVESPQPPGSSAAQAPIWNELFSGNANRSIEDLARAYKSWFDETVELAARGELSAAPSAGDRGKILNWLLKHEERLLDESSADKEASAALIAAYTRRQAEVLADVSWESRTAIAMWDGDGVDDRLLIRGNSRTPGGVVARGMLEAIDGPRHTASEQGSGRLELAQRLVGPANPFTSRVIVNRIWHHLFGQGLVPSVDNFGVLGQEATHPELLDYLAESFMQDGWSLKRLVRRLVLSSAYQMASSNAAGDAIDPTNSLIHRSRLRRLEGEAIRDAVLAVSGRLDRRQFGPSVPIYLTPFLQGRGRPAESGPLDGAGRRSVYLAVRKNFLSPMMLAFDAPIPLGTVGRRNVSNVPAQALIMLNDPFIIEQAREWGKQTLAGASRSFAARLKEMYLAAWSRPPTAAEERNAEAFLRSQGMEYGVAADAALEDERTWGDLAHVLLNAKEFIFLN